MSGVVNGFGTRLIGRFVPHEDDASWISVCWLVVFAVPLLPVGCWRVLLLHPDAEPARGQQLRLEKDLLLGQGAFETGPLRYILMKQESLRWAYCRRQCFKSGLILIWAWGAYLVFFPALEMFSQRNSLGLVAIMLGYFVALPIVIMKFGTALLDWLTDEPASHEQARDASGL